LLTRLITLTPSGWSPALPTYLPSVQWWPQQHIFDRLNILTILNRRLNIMASRAFVLREAKDTPPRPKSAPAERPSTFEHGNPLHVTNITDN
jgi:hypothetical protein